MNRYEWKQEQRRERLEARAARLAAEGRAKVNAGHAALSLIPFGQPILVGHYSERRDRNYRNKNFNRIGAGYAKLEEAAKVRGQAASVGTGGVSSDDPEAVAKLKEQLVKLEAGQERMAATNKLIRKHKANPDVGADAIAASIPGITRAAALELFKPDFAGRIGFAGYQLSNNSANIRRIKARIADLERNATRVESETVLPGGIKLVQNVEANRMQLIFPGKPSEAIRAKLKSYGFRWAPSEGAWQRQLNNRAVWIAQTVAEELTKMGA